MKTILVIGAGYLQTFTIKRAKELNYRVLSVDNDPNAPGFKYSDSYSVIDIIDSDSCLKYAKENQIDGVLTAATDYGVLTVSKIAETLGLSGNTSDVVKRIKDKAQVRKLLYENKIDDTPASFSIKSLKELQEKLVEIVYPVMVKPCDGSGSRGISRVDEEKKLEKAVDYAMENSLSKQAIIEPFILGKEYGVESFVHNGNVRILGVMRKQMTKAPYYAELGHVFPSGLSKSIENRIVNVVTRAIKILDIKEGGVNMDLLLTENGKIHIIDVGARMGGNLIYSHIIPLATGMDYLSNVIKSSVNDSLDWNLVTKPLSVSTRLLALSPGKVKRLPEIDKIEKKYEVKVYHYIKIGDILKEYHTNLDGKGYVISIGDDILETEERAEKAKRVMDLGIIRE